MGLAGILWRISVLVAFIAAIFLLPALKPHREKLSRLFATCPLHWFQSPAEETGIGSGIIKTGNHPIFTKEELSKYDGTEESLGLYIGIYGRVYDVSNGKDHYGPGGSYSFFAGNVIFKVAFDCVCVLLSLLNCLIRSRRRAASKANP